MKIVKEFSRFAHEYTKHNIIQLEVANKLTSMLGKKTYNKMADMGAGDGAVHNSLVAKNILVNDFLALDFSEEKPHDWKALMEEAEVFEKKKKKKKKKSKK